MSVLANCGSNPHGRKQCLLGQATLRRSEFRRNSLPDRGGVQNCLTMTIFENVACTITGERQHGDASD